MNMKFTRILTMLLVLTVSVSFTSCDEFLAIFDDPVETPDFSTILWRHRTL